MAEKEGVWMLTEIGRIRVILREQGITEPDALRAAERIYQELIPLFQEIVAVASADENRVFQPEEYRRARNVLEDIGKVTSAE